MLLHSSRPKTARPKQKCECGDGQQGDIQGGLPASAGGMWVGMKEDPGSLNLMQVVLESMRGHTGPRGWEMSLVLSLEFE